MRIQYKLALIPAKLGMSISKRALENLGYYEESVKKATRTAKRTTKKATKKAMKKTSTVKQTAMTINYGKSRTGLEDWFATGKKFTAKYNGWNTSNTRIFLIGSGSMSEAQFKKELKGLIKA